MLILTRKTNESVIISDNIRITVLGIQNGIVRLGLTAPNDVKIFREELLTRRPPNKQKENQSQDCKDSTGSDLVGKPAVDVKR